MATTIAADSGAEHQRYLHNLDEITDRISHLPAADQALIHAAFADGARHVTVPTTPAAADPTASATR